MYNKPVKKFDKVNSICYMTTVRSQTVKFSLSVNDKVPYTSFFSHIDAARANKFSDSSQLLTRRLNGRPIISRL